MFLDAACHRKCLKYEIIGCFAFTINRSMSRITQDVSVSKSSWYVSQESICYPQCLCFSIEIFKGTHVLQFSYDLGQRLCFCTHFDIFFLFVTHVVPCIWTQWMELIFVVPLSVLIHLEEMSKGEMSKGEMIKIETSYKYQHSIAMYHLEVDACFILTL